MDIYKKMHRASGRLMRAMRAEAAPFFSGRDPSAAPAYPDYTELLPPGAYDRRPPNVFHARSPSPDLLTYIYRHFSQQRVPCPSEGYLHLRTVYIAEGRYVIDANLDWMAPSIVDYAAANEVLPKWREAIAVGDFTRLDQREAGSTYVIIGKSGCSNYGHFLTDVAPKLMHLLRAKLGPIKILWPEEAARFGPTICDICNHIGLKIEIVRAPKNALLLGQDVLFFTPVAEHPWRKSPTLYELRNVLFSLYGVSFGAEKSLFIERGAKDVRRISNQPELLTSFENCGFEIVNPASLPFPDQVRLFARARRIAGGAGSGLANSLFAAPGTEVLMMGTGYPDLYFWDLSCLCWHEFNWYFAQDIVRWENYDQLADHKVDMIELTGVLQRLGWSGITGRSATATTKAEDVSPPHGRPPRTSQER